MQIYQNLLRMPNLTGLTGLVLLALALTSNTITFPNYISDIFILIWILIVPYGLGTLVLLLPFSYVKKISDYLESTISAKILIQWFLGVLLILAVMLAGSLISHRVLAVLGISFLIAAVLASFARSLAPRIYSVTHIQNYKPSIVALALGLVLGSAFGLYVHSFSPYPLLPGVDVFTHIYSVKAILDSSLSNIPLVYFPTLDILISMGVQTFHTDPVGVFWTGSMLIFCIFAVSIFSMSFSFTRNYVIAFVSTVAALAVTEQGLVPNLPTFYPSSFIMAIFPACIVVIREICKNQDRTRLHRTIRLTISGLLFLGLISIHLQLGLVASVLLLIFSGLSFIKKGDLFLLLRIATIGIVVIVFLYYIGYIKEQIHLRVFDGKYMYDTVTKANHLKSWYTDPLIVMSLLGLIALSLNKNRSLVCLSFLGSILLIVYFQQIDIVQRLVTLDRPILMFSASMLIILPAYGLLSKVNNVKNTKSTQPQNEGLDDRPRLRNLEILSLTNRMAASSLVYVLLIVLVLFPTFMKPYDLYLSAYFAAGNQFANFNNEELRAAKWVEHNTAANALIFSDPFTVLEMRGLAYRKNIEGIGWNPNVANSVKSVLTSTNPEEAHRDLISKFGQNTVIIIDPRTSKWLKSFDDILSFPVQSLENFSGFGKFFDSRYFDLIYRSQNIFVFIPK